MKKTTLILLALLAAGCKTEKADNSATRYAESLQQDVVKARDVADKANQAAAEQAARMKEMEAAGN
jgi:hypothetical protein